MFSFKSGTNGGGGPEENMSDSGVAKNPVSCAQTDGANPGLHRRGDKSHLHP